MTESTQSVKRAFLVEFTFVNWVYKLAFSIGTAWPISASCVYLDELVAEHWQRQMRFDVFSKVLLVCWITIRREDRHLFGNDQSK
jgi:hypothetical protein